MSLISGTTWTFHVFIPASHLCLLPALFPLRSECNQLWHEKTRSLSVRTLLVFHWQSSADSPSPGPKTASPAPPCLPFLTPSVLKHQNAIRPFKTPLVPWLAGPRTTVVHSETSIEHHRASAPVVVKNKTYKELFLKKNIGKWKTDGTSGAANIRENTITPHPVTVGHSNCLRQWRDGGAKWKFFLGSFSSNLKTNVLRAYFLYRNQTFVGKNRSYSDLIWIRTNYSTQFVWFWSQTDTNAIINSPSVWKISRPSVRKILIQHLGFLINK